LHWQRIVAVVEIVVYDVSSCTSRNVFRSILQSTKTRYKRFIIYSVRFCTVVLLVVLYSTSFFSSYSLAIPFHLPTTYPISLTFCVYKSRPLCTSRTPINYLSSANDCLLSYYYIYQACGSAVTAVAIAITVPDLSISKFITIFSIFHLK